MRNPDDFDAFYKDSRERLLVQTYALTGDLPAARKAVRDAYVVAWHRWSKISTAADPEKEVRPMAWRLAQRRHTARVWHRERDLDPGVKSTLEALGKLTPVQRRALLLTQLAAVSMSEMARDVGLPLETAEQELQRAAAEFSAIREVPATSLRALLEPVATTALVGTRWARPSIIRRAGAARRRSHTTVGVVAAVTALVVSGVVLSEGTPVRATLDRDRSASGSATPRAAEPPVTVLPASSLVTAEQLDELIPAREWESERTINRDEALGMRLPCQRERYADPDGTAAVLRLFTASASGDQAPLRSMQFTEASRDEAAAKRTYRASLRWYAGCDMARAQLLATQRPERLGDEAVQFVLRNWSDPVMSYVIGVARSGVYTTTTVVTERSADAAPNREGAAGMLSSAVDNLCVLPLAGTCGPPEPELNARSPLPVGAQPSLISEVDLPPVSGVDDPWVGTPAQSASASVAATRCDQADFTGSFQGSAFTAARARSFVIPQATDLPEVFGISETVASLPRAKAAAFLDGVRSRLADCPADDLGTESRLVDEITDGDVEAAVYEVSVDVADDQTITYFTAVMRDRTAVGQLSFVPAPEVAMADGAFEQLVARALERMREVPRPGA